MVTVNKSPVAPQRFQNDEQRVRERVQVSSDLVGSDLPHTLIDVRQIAACVKVRKLCDVLLEEVPMKFVTTTT